MDEEESEEDCAAFHGDFDVSKSLAALSGAPPKQQSRSLRRRMDGASPSLKVKFFGRNTWSWCDLSELDQVQRKCGA